jgi:hypothetical protein
MSNTIYQIRGSLDYIPKTTGYTNKEGLTLEPKRNPFVAAVMIPWGGSDVAIRYLEDLASVHLILDGGVLKGAEWPLSINGLSVTGKYQRQLVINSVTEMGKTSMKAVDVFSHPPAETHGDMS